MRRLEVSFGGYWYTALTIALGVVALVSGNNVLYLIESLLLSGMIFSGVLSERIVAGVDVEFRRMPSCAGSPARDMIRVKNRKRFAMFCVEVGEWRDKKFVPAAYVPRLGAQADILVSSRVEFTQRGVYRWEGVAVATSYPFGLVRKIRVIPTPGQRLIWPERIATGLKSDHTGDRGSGTRIGQEFAEGEVRPYTYEDDCRNIIWTLSDKGMGPLVRMRKSRQNEPRVVLDLRSVQGLDFEKKVVRAAQFFHRGDFAFSTDLPGEEGTLTIVDQSGSRTFRGRISSLNQLAVVQPTSSRQAEPATSITRRDVA